MKNFFLILVTIIWGSTFFMIKDTVATVNPFYIVFGRVLLASIPMLIYVFFKDKKSLLHKQTIIKGSVLGLLLTTTYVSQTYGLQYTSSGHSAFITSIAVVLVPVILFFGFKEQLIKSDYLSIFIVMIGLFLLTYDLETQFNQGDIITLITAISLAFHIVLSGRYVKTTEALSLITYQFVSASILSLIGSVWVGWNSQTPISFISVDSMISIAYLGIFGTLFCYFVSVWVQKYVSSVKVALVFSLEPVFAALFAYIFVNETLNFKEITGTLLILSGVVLYLLLRNRLTRTETSL